MPVADGAVALLVLAAQLAPFVSDERPGGPQWSWLIYLPVLGVSLPVLWLRRAPFVVLMVTELAAATYSFFPDGPRQPVWYGPLVAMFAVAAYARRWQRITAIVVIACGASILTGSLDTAVRGTLLWTTAYALGRAWAARRAHVDALQERALHLQRERELEAERERSRIARDMHDILGHAVAVMIAQAEAGPVTIRQGPERTEAAFDAIASAGRDAMVQLRGILGVLDEGAQSRTRPPQASLAGVPELVERVSRSGGVAATVRESGTGGTLTAEAEVAAYRIVQEALTNVVKHARASTATVSLDWREGDLFLTVTDDGQGDTGGTGGRGLAGITQRASGCGGSAQAGPTPHGRGYTVSARLPGRETEMTQ
ncbi:Signal transduction histidine kinase [Cryptosporangium aurantiacum]|uniref:histidine kinase n=1 Tax=Cryptosporangium aurantiacum TaxID=134849 RepID=A0A1M7PRQ5_9ACTN|nr:histidine kinase [Cryptosporangium aurantiacum]SHN19976.1 Signal transduction histidine kinase [Cryptosporangium aurantiacum]